jgi:hypothetical protein
MFNRVVEQAVERKVTKGTRMRVDTAVVEAPIRHPAGSGLCEDSVRVLNRSLKRLAESDRPERPLTSSSRTRRSSRDFLGSE